MSLATRAVVDQLQDWMQRLQRAINALQDLEEIGVIPKGTVVLPTTPAARSSSLKRSPKADPIKTAEGAKTCTKCGKTKPVPEFTCGGKRAWCKQCVREYQKAWAAAKKKKISTPSQNPSPDKPELKYHCERCQASFRNLYSLAEHNKLRHS